ncbi:MAG: LamG domain-containing protein [Lentisphaerae bacterium]|nr:LamG domain-containing protein [Lentisphaerota bacterium]
MEEIKSDALTFRHCHFLTGSIDEVRVWNIARTQEEIQASMNSTLAGNETGLAGYWQFNEGTGIDTVDLTGNADIGVLVSGPVWVVSDAPVTDEIDLNAGLIANYTFSGNANDESGNLHHGTVEGATLAADRFGNAESGHPSYINKSS